MRTGKDVRTLEQRLSRILWKLNKQQTPASQIEFIQGAIEALKWVDGITTVLEEFAKDQESILEGKWKR